jgi:LuxR family maltose regulon positive regulatory protein
MTKSGKKHRPEPHYCAPSLRRKLGRIPSLPVVIVEAPSGCGKTTAVRDFLKGLAPEDAAVHWLTAIDEAPAAGYRRLCRALLDIDERAGQRLKQIGLPDAAALGDACDALRSVRCREGTYLVVDNFDHCDKWLLRPLQEALMEHGEGLHLVLIARQFTDGMRLAAAGRGAMRLTADDLRLGAEDIRSYGALCGAELSAGEAEAIHRHTGGWMVAVVLQVRAYRETGAIEAVPDIALLMERLAWEPLTPEQRAFLMKLSPFEAVTTRQACALAGAPALPEYALDALKNPFIQYDRQQDRYEPHAVLRDVLASKRKACGAAFERECLAGAGDLCLAEGAADRALRFYMEAGEPERALALDLAPLIFEWIGEEPFPAVAPRILKGCPESLRRGHPLSMLQLAWALLAAGEGAAFDGLMEELRAALEREEPEDGALLKGEWLLLDCWRHAPDLPAMIELVRQAEPLFAGRRSRVILPSAPWCFGNFSQMCAFDALFRAELAHYRGEWGEAEVLLYKAGHLAERNGQRVIQLGVALHLAEIAVERADMALWQRTIADMERAVSGAGQGGFVLPATADMVRSVLLVELGYPKRIAPWLREGRTSGRILPAAEHIALFTRLNCLMHEGEFARLAGMAEAGLRELKRSDVLLETLVSIQAAVGRLWLGNAARAEALIRRAAEISLPDGLVHLFAAYDTEALKGMAEKLIRAEYPLLLHRFLAVKARFSMGYGVLRTGIAAADLPRSLTAREREVAVLAAGGLRNGEIAKKLGASENTVRAHLRAVYQKVGVDRRARLAEKL